MREAIETHLGHDAPSQAIGPRVVPGTIIQREFNSLNADFEKSYRNRLLHLCRCDASNCSCTFSIDGFDCLVSQQARILLTCSSVGS
jgi:hypothetical protein